MTSPQDPFRAPDGPSGQPAPYGPPPGQPAPYGQPGVTGSPATGPSAGDPFAGGPPAPGWPPQPGGGGGYGSAPVVKKNGFGVAALVLGVLALVLFWTLVGGLVLGVAAVVLGVMGRGRAKRGEADNGGLATAGIVLGVLGLLASVAIIALGASFLSQNSGSFSDLTSCLQEAQGDPNAEAECQADFEDDLTS